MPANQTLTAEERSDLASLGNDYQTFFLGEDWPGLMTDRGYNGSHALLSAACWNWALNAGEGNIHAATSAQQLYLHVGDIVLEGANYGGERTELVRDNFPGSGFFEFRRLNSAWKSAKNGTDWRGRPVGAVRLRERRLAFLVEMMHYVLKQNGFTTSRRAVRGGDHLVIAMVTKEDTWQSWDHWAVKIYDDAGNFTYAQKEPNDPLSIGFDRLWEADRDGRLVGEVPVTGLHPAHVGVLRYELAQKDD